MKTKLKFVKGILVLLVLLASIGIASAYEIGVPLTPLTIGGIASSGYFKVERGGATYSPAISIPFTTTIDSNCADGSCNALFGGVSILNSAKVPVWSTTSWISITSASPWTYTIPAIAFPTDGKYYIVAIIANTQATFSGSVWTQASTNVAQESITVEVVTPSVVVISPTAPTIQLGGTPSSVQLTAQVIDNAATPAVMTGKTVTWNSNNAGVASVSATGLVTSVGIGQASITATHSGVYAVLTDTELVTVTAPGIVISPPTSAIAAFIAAIWAFLRGIFPFLPANM